MVIFKVYSVCSHSVVFRWLHVIVQRRKEELLLHRDQWHESSELKLLIPPACNRLKQHVFTAHTGSECVFSFGTEELHCMPETMDHRLMRRRKIFEHSVRFLTYFINNLLPNWNFLAFVRVYDCFWKVQILIINYPIGTSVLLTFYL